MTEENIVYIQLVFKLKDKKLLSEFSLMTGSVRERKEKAPHLFEQERTSAEKSLVLPVSINEDSLGKPLVVEVSDDATGGSGASGGSESGATQQVITNIPIEIGGKLVNFLALIKAKASILRGKHKDNITSFDPSYKFYLLKDRYQYILAVKVSPGSPGDQVDTVDKIKYSLNGGQCGAESCY